MSWTTDFEILTFVTIWWFQHYWSDGQRCIRKLRCFHWRQVVQFVYKPTKSSCNWIMRWAFWLWHLLQILVWYNTQHGLPGQLPRQLAASYCSCRAILQVFTRTNYTTAERVDAGSCIASSLWSLNFLSYIYGYNLWKNLLRHTDCEIAGSSSEASWQLVDSVGLKSQTQATFRYILQMMCLIHNNDMIVRLRLTRSRNHIWGMP